jgi:hypothetical protein
MMNSIQKYLMPGLLVICTLLVAFWQVMSWVSRRPYESFALTPESMVSCQPALEGWVVRALPITRDKLVDANIASYSVAQDSSSSPNNHFLVRLVHGYNMPMCMKMKYYTVEKILDNLVITVSDPKLQSAFRVQKPHAGEEKSIEQKHAKDAKEENGVSAGGGEENPSLRTSRASVQNPDSVPELPFQLWRVTSSVGTVSIWVTTMIRADDFSPTTEDICSMVFPRIEIPDDPHWVPRGLGIDDLKHPVVSFSRWYHSRWDGARWDVMTFLKLRQPARTSEEYLSYITRMDGLPDNVVSREDVQTLLKIHRMMLNELQGWRNGSGGVIK